MRVVTAQDRRLLHRLAANQSGTGFAGVGDGNTRAVPWKRCQIIHSSIPLRLILSGSNMALNHKRPVLL